jgi:hypothetical protein
MPDSMPPEKRVGRAYNEFQPMAAQTERLIPVMAMEIGVFGSGLRKSG